MHYTPLQGISSQNVFHSGLFNMLHDGNQESREHASEVLRDLLNQLNEPFTIEFLQMAETLIKQASSFDTLTRLNALTCVAREINNKLGSVMANPCNLLYVFAIMDTVRSELMDMHDATKLEALKWMSFLLGLHRQPVIKWYERETYISDASIFDDVFPPGYSYRIEEGFPFIIVHSYLQLMNRNYQLCSTSYVEIKDLVEQIQAILRGFHMG